MQYRTGGECVIITVASDGVLKHCILSHIEKSFQRPPSNSATLCNSSGDGEKSRHVSLSVGDEKVLITGSVHSSLNLEICDFLQETKEQLMQVCQAVPKSTKSSSMDGALVLQNYLPTSQFSVGKPSVSEPSVNKPSVSIGVSQSTIAVGSNEDWEQEVAGEERPAFQFGQGQFKHFSVAINSNSSNSTSEWNRLAANKTKKEIKSQLFSKYSSKPRPAVSTELSTKAHNRDIRLFDDLEKEPNVKDTPGLKPCVSHSKTVGVDSNNGLDSSVDSENNNIALPLHSQTVNNMKIAHSVRQEDPCVSNCSKHSSSHTLSTVKSAGPKIMANPSRIGSAGDISGTGKSQWNEVPNNECHSTHDDITSCNAQVEKLKISQYPSLFDGDNSDFQTLNSCISINGKSFQPFAFNRSVTQRSFSTDSYHNKPPSLQRMSSFDNWRGQQNTSRLNWESAKKGRWRPENISINTTSSEESPVYKPVISSSQPLYTRQDLLSLSMVSPSHKYPENLFNLPDFLDWQEVIIKSPISEETQSRKYFSPADLKTPGIECVIPLTPHSPDFVNSGGFSFPEKKKVES
ncbi:uncharacterized protein [Watersipora subatra]|uniref:uncharacterized protein n=1 Tax=Watersipora subatra TaxID=2589382 RepID=UPI00355BE230